VFLTIGPRDAGGVQSSFTIEGLDGWTFDYEARVTQAPHITELRIRSVGDVSGGITGELLRRIPIGEVLDAVSRKLRTMPLDQFDYPAAERREVRALGRRFAAQPRPGRRGRDDEFYAVLANEYLRLLATGSRRPVADLARLQHLSVSQVRSLLVGARRRGLLTPGLVGRPGGSLTDKAEALLTESPRSHSKGRD
jgi:hypothetical protein